MPKKINVTIDSDEALDILEDHYADKFGEDTSKIIVQLSDVQTEGSTIHNIQSVLDIISSVQSGSDIGVGRKISAIEKLRAEFGWSLKTSKAFVEQNRNFFDV